MLTKIDTKVPSYRKLGMEVVGKIMKAIGKNAPRKIRLRSAVYAIRELNHSVCIDV